MNITLVGTVAQFIQKAWGKLTKFCLLELLYDITKPYMSFNSVVIQFQVLSEQLDDFILLRKKDALFEAGAPTVAGTR